MLLQLSAYNLQKKIKMYQYSFYDYYLVYIFATVGENQRQFQIPIFFCILFLTPLNKLDLILATQSKLLFASSYLKLTAECLSC